MKNLIIFLKPLLLLLWVCCFSSETQGKLVQGPLTSQSNFHRKTSTGLDFIQTTECSGAIEAESGQLLYKVDEGLASYETCVWVLRTVNTTDYFIGIFDLGFQNPSDEAKLSLSCTAFGSPLTHVTPASTGLQQMHNCTYIIVTFTTGNIVSPKLTGFSLEFAGYNNNGLIRTPSITSRDYIVDENVGYLRHPTLDKDWIGAWELSTFVFIPSSHMEELNVLYVRNCLQVHNAIALNVYALNKSSSDLWTLDDRIFWDTEMTVLSTKEPFLIIFETGNIMQRESRGFYFVTKCHKNLEFPTTEPPTEPPTDGPTDPPKTDGPTDPPITDGPTDPPITDGPTDPPNY